MKWTILFALALMGACGDNTGNTGTGDTTPADADTDTDTDSDTDSDTTKVTVAAQINFAVWNDDQTEVIDDRQDAPGVGFTVDDGTTGVTTKEISISSGVHTVTFETEKTSKYIGSVTGSTEDGALIGDLCVDLSGDWDCWYEGYESNKYPTEAGEMDGCTFPMNGVGKIDIDGLRISFNGSDGTSSATGVVNESGDNITLIASGNGHTVNGTCQKQ